VIVESFSDTAETKFVVSNGIHINGEKYITLDSDKDSLKAKKVRPPSPPNSPLRSLPRRSVS
jgi:hypothetical protein